MTKSHKKIQYQGLPTTTTVLVLPLPTDYQHIKTNNTPYHSSDPFLDPPPHASENITSHIHQPAQLLPWIPLSLLGCREPITAVWFQDGSLKCLALGFLITDLMKYWSAFVNVLCGTYRSSIATKTCTYKLFYHAWTVFLFSLFNNVFSLLTSHLRRNQQYEMVITRHEGCEGKNEISVIKHPVWTDICALHSTVTMPIIWGCVCCDIVDNRALWNVDSSIFKWSCEI